MKQLDLDVYYVPVYSVEANQCAWYICMDWQFYTKGKVTEPCGGIAWEVETKFTVMNWTFIKVAGLEEGKALKDLHTAKIRS